MRPGERMVRLADGREVSNYDPAWRAECEAREIMGWPRERRQEFYLGVVKFRGKQAALELRDRVSALYRSTQENR